MDIMDTKCCKICGEVKPLELFMKNKHGYTAVCQKCANDKRRRTKLQKAANVRRTGLSEFTPRELMLELKRRGYEGTLRYIQVHNIDITKLD